MGGFGNPAQVGQAMRVVLIRIARRFVQALAAGRQCW
jgi:hypothetical protein